MLTAAQSPDRVAGRDSLNPEKPSTTAIENAIKSGMDQGPLLSKVRVTLLLEKIDRDDKKQREHMEHLLDDSDLLWHALLGRISA